MTPPERDPGLVRLLVGDGRPLIALNGLALLGSGLFALFLSVRGEFLPHDLAYLGQSADQLCGVNQCRLVHFLIHDRAAFGGALAAVGLMYLWLVAGPLAAGEWWAWHTLLASGLVGFASFFGYLGYGYLDVWHATATVVLAPCFAAGLWLTRRTLRPADPTPFGERLRHLSPGRALLLASAAGMVAGGSTITAYGLTTVFVPEDVAYLGIDRAGLDAINPRLVPLVTHDRVGFGGAAVCCGLALAGTAWHARWTRSLRHTLVLCGLLGFGPAVLAHFAVGYTDPWHLAPPVAGSALYAGGLALGHGRPGLGRVGRRLGLRLGPA